MLENSALNTSQKDKAVMLGTERKSKPTLICRFLPPIEVSCPLLTANILRLIVLKQNQ
jgi:hypothetical protein